MRLTIIGLLLYLLSVVTLSVYGITYIASSYKEQKLQTLMSDQLDHLKVQQQEYVYHKEMAEYMKTHPKATYYTDGRVFFISSGSFAR